VLFNVDPLPVHRRRDVVQIPFLQPCTKPIQRQYTAVPIPEYYQLPYFFHMLWEVHIPIALPLQNGIYDGERSRVKPV
jgi:hypothetical protein